MNGTLSGKAALVTGGGTNIGQAIARRFAAEGAKVMVCGRTQTTLDATVAAIEHDGGTAASLICDVTRKSDIEDLVAQTAEQFGGVDIAVQNAGVGPVVPLQELSEADYRTTIDTNLSSAFWLCAASMPHFKRCASGGRMLITSSTLGIASSHPHLSHYAASRGGLRAFVRNAALELAAVGATINAVECGMIAKEDMDNWHFASRESTEAMSKLIPAKRLGVPADIAHAMLFLASPDSSYVTGQILVVDGGATLPHVFTTISRGRD